MFNHFDYLAPIYDKLIPPTDPLLLQALLELPAQGNLLDAAGGTGRASAGLRGSVEHIVVCDRENAPDGQEQRIGNNIGRPGSPALRG